MELRCNSSFHQMESAKKDLFPSMSCLSIPYQSKIPFLKSQLKSLSFLLSIRFQLRCELAISLPLASMASSISKAWWLLHGNAWEELTSPPSSCLLLTEKTFKYQICSMRHPDIRIKCIFHIANHRLFLLVLSLQCIFLFSVTTIFCLLHTLYRNVL